MTELIITRYLHFIAVFAIVGAIVAEQFVIAPKMTRREIKTISKIDAFYGFGAILVLIAGLLLWFSVGKPASFYSRNWIFHTKLTMFVLLGLISIYPTIFFLRNRKGSDLDTVIDVPKIIITAIRIELLLIILMPVTASMMSLGIGTF